MVCVSTVFIGFKPTISKEKVDTNHMCVEKGKFFIVNVPPARTDCKKIPFYAQMIYR